MSIAHRQNRLLIRPDKEYFELWKELGTLVKVSKHLANLGEINPKLKQPFSEMTVRIAAYRYVIEFPEEAKETFDNEYGRVLSQKEWEEFLVNTAVSVYDSSTDKLKNWIERKGMQQYDYIYGRKFPDGKLG
jgi:hypothetical protein